MRVTFVLLASEKAYKEEGMEQREGALVFVGSLNRVVPHFEAANGCGISTLALDERTGKLQRQAQDANQRNQHPSGPVVQLVDQFIECLIDDIGLQ